MRTVEAELIFRYGKTLDDLTALVGSNPRFVFALHKRKRGKLGWTIWRHKQQRSHRGDVKLFQRASGCWCRISDRSDGLLTGAFLSWLVRNAPDIVHRVDVRLS